MDNKLYKLMNWPRVEGIIYSEEDNPHEILGPHAVSKNTLFQTLHAYGLIHATQIRP